ncbi:uncharacterized protein PV06_11635 [Exophiala oligosperma]|uniref:Uncharacterized protein n=1 Tax=Exophiala oligosperma TaxID=215243 RepID=A0A0D2D1J1_9EURO|nr:uncharacterized protein PV06_11635 [Exophiala oligosperma]KIW36055.1 hypothetical protein PV06_11635 [Exophiala oligosperma]
MPKTRRTFQRSQFDVLDQEARIEEERKQRFYGSARVDLDALTFDTSPACQVHEPNIERLVSAFQRAGCLRLHPQYHVPAIVVKGELDTAIANAASSQDALLHHDPSKWPTLIFPDTLRIQCLHGRHRVEAGRRYLSVNDRWWVVDFYAPDLSAELRAKLVQQNLNEQPPNVGDVFFHILNCIPTDTKAINFWWSQIHSKDEIRELQRLLKKPSLVGAFRQVAQIPAFGRELLPGNIGGLLRLKCDEEIVHYLLYICNAWRQLLNGVTAAERRVDPQAVTTVRLRNAMYCRTDRDFLEPLVRRGMIFGNFQASERQVIWRNMKRFPGRIPSLGVFFEDFKYLEDVAACLKWLFDIPRGQTVFQVLNQSYVSVSSTEASRDSSTQEAGHRISREDCFDIAKRRLVLFVMQHLESLRPGSILLEQDGVKNIVETTSQVQHQLVREAYNLGFRSAKLIDVLFEDPDRIEARRSLLRARDPQYFVYDEAKFESLVDRLVETYAEAQRIERDPGPCIFVANGNGECLKRRCGRPYQRAFAESATFMTLENMHKDQHFGLGGLAPLFIRRDVYLAFFGPLDSAHLSQARGPEVNLTPRATLHDSGVVESGNVLGHASAYEFPTSTLGPDILHNSPSSSNAGSALVLSRRPRAESYSPSQYSQSQDEHPAPDMTGASESGQGSAGISFVVLERNKRRTAGLIPLNERVQLAVGELVAQYAERGYHPFDSSFHALAAHQCVRAAMEEPDRSVLLIHEDEVRVQNFKTLDSQSRKRRASGELGGRPRKFLVF